MRMSNKDPVSNSGNTLFSDGSWMDWHMEMDEETPVDQGLWNNFADQIQILILQNYLLKKKIVEFNNLIKPPTYPLDFPI